ncbi:MAG: AAA family ATPase [Candidatus Hodarchaeales archaeon]
MKGDVLISIFKAYVDKDWNSFLELANKIIREEERKNHHKLVNELRKIINQNPSNFLISNKFSKKFKTDTPIPRDSTKGFPLLEIKESYYNFFDLIIDFKVKKRLQFLIEEYFSRDLLATYGLKPKQKLLFCGPPGTGKTLTAGILSSELRFPLVHIRLDSIISSYLGETATNLRKIFDFINKGEWVVLFDEFDIIGKKRDDPDEHGEIKRVVNNFMQMLDGYTGKSLIIAATNHQHLLDIGLWRRFDDVYYFDYPSEELREKIFTKYLSVLRKSPELKASMSKFVKKTEKYSPADIALVCKDALTIAILSDRKIVSVDDLTEAIDIHTERKSILQ